MRHDDHVMQVPDRAGPQAHLALDKKLAKTDSEPWCGVQVIDLNTGACVHWFRIDGPVG